MAFAACLGLALLLFVWSTADCDPIPNGVHYMECHDRYFMIAVDLSFAGNEPHFTAIDGTGIHLITEQYAAKCGYSVSVLPQQGYVVLEASYFSCHTENQDDELFTFNFQVMGNHNGKEVTYALNKTCSPSLAWSPREVTCEENYMEVSLRSVVACPTETARDNWDDAVQTSYTSANPDWQVMFQGQDKELKPMTLSKAEKQGYEFDRTDGRLVFRTPYGQPDAFSTEVNGVPVEVVHATLFSRQNWVVLMVDLVAACSMYEGSYDNGYMMWETPDVLHPLAPGLHDTQINIGVNGELVEQSIAEARGYIVEKNNSTVQIKIPYNAEGAYRKSLEFANNLYEYYIFHLYLELILVGEDHLDARLRYHRTLSTPLLLCPVFTENRTVQEERVFTIYLGNIPEDVSLVAVNLNGHNYTVPFANTSSHTITKVIHPNNTHGYTLKVPFDNPVVIQEFVKEHSSMQYRLNINYTVMVLPENELYYHSASVMALADVSPPVFDAVCSESGINFKLDHRPSDYMWYITIGSDLLTPELATQHGYIMSNDSQSLLLEVPLYAQGYEYKDITLKRYRGTFEILVRDRETSEVQSSSVKTCPFTTNELIMCSTDGRMTVVADLSRLLPSGGNPARTNLKDKYCGPKEADDSRALFSFPLNSCGSVVELGVGSVTYKNEIFVKRFQAVKNPDSGPKTHRVIMQCTYPLAGLYRLFSVYRFESSTVGVGSIIHSPEDVQGPTAETPTVLQTLLPITRRNLRPSYHPPARHIRVSEYLKNLSKKGAKGSSQIKVTAIV